MKKKKLLIPLALLLALSLVAIGYWLLGTGEVEEPVVEEPVVEEPVVEEPVVEK